MRMLCVALIISLLFLPTRLLATPQGVRDNVIWGGSLFQTPQLPLEEKLQQEEIRHGKELLHPSNSGNNRGYKARWRITNRALFLEEFEGEDLGKKVKVDEIFKDAVLPMKAAWFTGRIQLPIGEFDFEKQTWPILIELSFKDGDLIDSVIQKDCREAGPFLPLR